MSGVGDIWDQVGLLDVNGEDLTDLVYDNHAVGGRVSSGDEAQLIGDLDSEEKTGG